MAKKKTEPNPDGLGFDMAAKLLEAQSSRAAARAEAQAARVADPNDPAREEQPA